LTEQLSHLCAISELGENNSKRFILTHPRAVDIFVVHKRGNYYGYINSCPHTGINLDWTPDQFLDITSELIQCATPGALFSIKTGLCIRGPCIGQSLSAVEIIAQAGELYAKLPSAKTNL
jgi:nitrite reductase/ring-hydroxylating ferredoxin subunit